MEVKLKAATAPDIYKLVKIIPEFTEMPEEEISARIKNRHPQLFYTESHSEITGFIVAYPDGSKSYYNWLMGVAPKYRGQQLGKGLLAAYEKYALENGFKKCRVKSKNQFRQMLHLLLSHNYNIISVVNQKIVFEIDIIAGGEPPPPLHYY